MPEGVNTSSALGVGKTISYLGGGIWGAWSGGILINNNTAARGGGLLCEFDSAPVITNVTIVNNQSQEGASLFSRYNANISVNNSIIWTNIWRYSRYHNKSDTH